MQQNPLEPDTNDDPNIARELLQEQDNRVTQENVSRFWFSRRFFIAILIFFGYINITLLKANLNIAVVEMTSKKPIISGNDTIYEKAEFDWNSKTVGIILSMYAYGYQACLVGGFIVNKLGGATTFGGAILLMSVLNTITPILLNTNFYIFLASRILIGVGDGLAYTGVIEILSRWAPIQERSRMSCLGFNGLYIGFAASYPVCGYLTYKWGWPSSFYAAGIMGIIWYAIWLPIVKNQPSKDKHISKKELMYILQNTDNTPRKQIKAPYKKILKSSPVWALCVAQFVYNWGFTLLVTCFPLYVKDTTGRNIEEVGLISSIPNLVCMFMIPLAGVLMDFWQNNSSFKRTQIHKIMMSIGFLSGSISFAIAAYSTSFNLSMACFVTIKLMLSFNFLLLHLVCLGMSSKHSSALAGIAAFWHTLSVIMIPNIVGLIVQNHSLEEWSTCFLLSAAVLFLGAVIFVIFGSSELQPWSKSDSDDIGEKFDIENK